MTTSPSTTALPERTGHHYRDERGIDQRTAEERAVDDLLDTAGNWSPTLRRLGTVAQRLPNTDARSGFDYIREARDVSADARSLREHGYDAEIVGKHLDGVDVSRLTEAQQTAAAIEQCDFIARDVLVRAVRRDVELAEMAGVA